uniref:Uncharacterized protein LOC117346910 n=1 Tax=Geotrypetes seraphini TaxID=260995 RepID=A0A6P8PDZ4_GEOSA|nr:uncharacterized protein LOC117346910 [Geotrypetes seraphini]XP_033773048.1 uncharacterized protein LOC117346910 [Geotrypetes seraphini]
MKEEEADSPHPQTSIRQQPSLLPGAIEDPSLEVMESRLLNDFLGYEVNSEELLKNIETAVEEIKGEPPEEEGMENGEECAVDPIKDSPEHQEEEAKDEDEDEEKDIAVDTDDMWQEHSLVKEEICGLRSDVQSLIATVHDGLSNIGGILRVIEMEFQTLNQTLISLLPQLVPHSSSTTSASNVPTRATPVIGSQHGPPILKFQNLVFPNLQDSGVGQSGLASSGQSVLPQQCYGFSTGGPLYPSFRSRSRARR